MRSWRLYIYIIRETLAPFALGLCVLTAVLLLGRMLRLVEMVINKGVPIAETAKLFLYLIPSFLTLCLPLAFLLGVILAYGRLSSDGEIIALKATGFSARDLIAPTFMLSIPVCLLTAMMSLYLQPLSYHAFRNQIFNILNSSAHVGLQERVFIDEFRNLVLYTNNLDDRSGAMQGVFIQDSRVADQPSIILARRGRLLSDPEARTLNLRLEEGSIHRAPEGQMSRTYQTIGFDRYDVNLNMDQQPESESSRTMKDKELSLSDLRQRIASSNSPEQKNRDLSALHKRFALPFAPLIFALLGAPLGMTSNRSGKGGGFALALLIFISYYLLLSFAETLGAEGIIPPAIALWIPNITLLALGLTFVRRATLDRPMPRITVPGALKKLWKQRGRS